MTKDVWISIRGEQFNEGETEAGTVGNDICGTYYEKCGKHYVIYEETMEGLQKPVMNKLKFTERVLELTRSGSVNVRMVFEENKKHMADYHTPYGVMALGIHTKKFDVINETDKIALNAEYMLEQNNEYLANCKILIEIRPKEA